MDQVKNRPENPEQLSWFSQEPKPYHAVVNQITNQHLYQDPHFSEFFVFRWKDTKGQIRKMKQASTEFSRWTDCLESYTHTQSEIYCLCRQEKREAAEEKLRKWKKDHDLLGKLVPCEYADQVPDHIMLNLLLNRMVGTDTLRGQPYRYLVSDGFRMVRTESPWITKKQIHAIHLRFFPDRTLQAATETYTKEQYVSETQKAKYPHGYLATDTTFTPFQFLVTVPSDSVSVKKQSYIKKQIFPKKASRLYWVDLHQTKGGKPDRELQATKFEHFIQPAIQAFEQEYSYPLQFRAPEVKTIPEREPAWSWEQIFRKNPLSIRLEDQTEGNPQILREIQDGLSLFVPYGITINSDSPHRLTLIHDKEYYERPEVQDEDPYRREWNCQHLTVETWLDHAGKKKDSPDRKESEESLLSSGEKPKWVLSSAQKNILQVCILSLILQENLTKGKLNVFPWNETEDWVAGAQIKPKQDEDTEETEPELFCTFLILHPDRSVELGTEAGDFSSPEQIYPVQAAPSQFPDSTIVIKRGSDINVVEDTNLCFLPYGFLNLPLVRKSKEHPLTRTTGQDALNEYCREMINTVAIPTDDPHVFYYAVSPLSGNGENPTGDFGHQRTWLRKVTCIGNSRPFVLDHPELFRATFVSLSRKYTIYPFLVALMKTDTEKQR